VRRAARVRLPHTLLDPIDGAKGVSGLLVVQAQLRGELTRARPEPAFQTGRDALVQQLPPRRRDARELDALSFAPQLMLLADERMVLGVDWSITCRSPTCTHF